MSATPRKGERKVRSGRGREGKPYYQQMAEEEEAARQRAGTGRGRGKGSSDGALGARLDECERTADALVDEVRKRRAGLTAGQLAGLGQAFFARLALDDRNTNEWVKVQWLELQREQFKFSQTKFKASVRSKSEAGKAMLVKKFRKDPEAWRLYREACALVGVPPGGEALEGEGCLGRGRRSVVLEGGEGGQSCAEEIEDGRLRTGVCT